MVLKNLYANYHAYLAARQVEKFLEVPHASPKVIGPQTQNCKPVFKCSFLKIVGRSPFPVPCALASLGQSLARVQI